LTINAICDTLPTPLSLSPNFRKFFVPTHSTVWSLRSHTHADGRPQNTAGVTHPGVGRVEPSFQWLGRAHNCGQWGLELRNQPGVDGGDFGLKGLNSSMGQLSCIGSAAPGIGTGILSGENVENTAGASGFQTRTPQIKTDNHVVSSLIRIGFDNGARGEPSVKPGFVPSDHYILWLWGKWVDM
jgi:hypothetical protein